jgi:NAD(P)-dependent dehydrogenase (short-subunit alcohol dehydrogenase family)
MNNQRTVFLTGGARGIGAAIREELLMAGYTVISPSREELDLASKDSVEAYLRDHSDIAVDVLINNAGMNVPEKISKISWDTWNKTLQINLGSAVRLIQFLAPGMSSRGYGRILNTSSILGLVTKEGRAAYSMTKAALNAFTRSAALEFGADGVLVNSLAPGYVDTELTRKNNSPEALASIIRSIPLGRMADPKELARVASFLVSDQNTYLTGQTIVVDGGFTCS